MPENSAAISDQSPDRRQPPTLEEVADLEDETGDDIREYTGEPVETDEGVVVPQQQNAGPGNVDEGGAQPEQSHTD
jgi:hypothetical protein